MQTDARDPLQDTGSTDNQASCPHCGEPISGLEATARGTRNAACGHQISSRTGGLTAGGITNAQ